MHNRLVFSQFYDSVYALAGYLVGYMDEFIGIYSSSSSSNLFEGGKVQSINRELLKEKVAKGWLKLLIGTDAAAPDLICKNLVALSTWICRGIRPCWNNAKAGFSVVP